MPNPNAKLTKTETIVAFELSKGMQYKELAEYLNLSASAIGFHATNIKRKIDVRTMMELYYYRPDLRASAPTAVGEQPKADLETFHLPDKHREAKEKPYFKAKTSLFKSIYDLPADNILLGYLSLPEKARQDFCKAARLECEYTNYADAIEGTQDGDIKG